MKKWLDDLYAIILKRGFKTLDNSLKNYDKLDKQIAKLVQTGTVEANNTSIFNMVNYDCQINDVILCKCIFSDRRVIVIPIFKSTEHTYFRFNPLGTSTGVNITFSDANLIISNSTENNLNYTLYLNKL